MDEMDCEMKEFALWRESTVRKMNYIKITLPYKPVKNYKF